jgi:hypothetical protein
MVAIRTRSRDAKLRVGKRLRLVFPLQLGNGAGAASSGGATKLQHVLVMPQFLN